MTPSRRLGLALLLLIVLCAVAAARLYAAGPGQVLAWQGGEVWGHLWTQTWHARALPAWPLGTDLAVNTQEWPVIDPIPTLLAAALGQIVGRVAAWNVLALLALGGAFAGGWWAARRAGGSGPVGGLVLAMGPIFTGSLVSGLTEDWAVGLLAVVASLILHPPAMADGRPWGEAPRTRSWVPDWRPTLALGLGLGLLAWCGLYLAWLGALVAVGAGIARMALHPREFGRLGLAALLAIVVALPAAGLQGDRLRGGDSHHAGVRPGSSMEAPLPAQGPQAVFAPAAVSYEPLWRVNPWGGADLASFVTPGVQALPDDAIIRLHPVYLGCAALVLALMGGRSRWWLILILPMAVAPGPILRFQGNSLGVVNPVVAAFHTLPLADLFNHHARLFLLGQVALAVLAARGARRFGRFAPIAALPVVIEYATLSPVAWPLPVADATPPDFLADLDALPAGTLLWLPMGGPGIHPQRALADQAAHSRPIVLDPNHPGPPRWLANTDEGRWLSQVSTLRGPTSPPPDDLCLLVQEHVAVLAVAAPWPARVVPILGPPDVMGKDGAAWDLAKGCDGGE